MAQIVSISIDHELLMKTAKKHLPYASTTFYVEHYTGIWLWYLKWPGSTIRMNREVHPRFCVGLWVKFQRSTRPLTIKAVFLNMNADINYDSL